MAISGGQYKRNVLRHISVIRARSSLEQKLHHVVITGLRGTFEGVEIISFFVSGDERQRLCL